MTAVVALGSALTDRHPDNGMVTLVPTTGPTPTGEVDATPPAEGLPTDDPTAASTSGPSPVSPTTPGDDATEGPDPTAPDETSPDPDPTSPDPGPTTPDPRTPDPRTPETPSDPPTEEPPPSDDPEPSDPPGGSAPELTCTADASAKSVFLGIGMEAVITITNTSDATVDGWTSTFTLPGRYQIVDAHDGEVVEDGKHAAIRDDGSNAVIEPGQSVRFGFDAQGWGKADAPTNIALNGTACG